jgi:cytochrome c oxidase assembly protein subunit 15
MARDTLLFRLGGAATVVALCVVVLGAWVRLSDAGLGCPDWPGCYGHVDVPAGAGERAAAQAAYPERPLEPAKAWKEMVHRYAAGALGLLVAALAAVAVARRRRGVAPGLPVALLALVIFQALLGMWTVTLLLKPIIVLAHLLGGLALLAGLTWLTLSHAPRVPNLVHPPWLRGWVLVGAGVLVLQIMLGGWTSTNYAALACPDFPTCQGEWWPETDFANAFVPWRGLGIDYAGGVLRGPARTAIHMSHRLGAVAVTVVLGGLALACLWPGRARRVQFAGAGVLALLALQLGLGIANIVWLLPLALATAHNGGAALLVMALTGLLGVLTRSTPDAR